MAVSIQKPFDVADDYHALAFVVKSLLGRTATVTLVKVVSCTNTGGLSPWGFVDVLPLVNQVTGNSESVPHGTLYRLPYFRLQGGKNAIIMDPEKDDIGLAAFASRDISSVKADPAAAIANANAGKGGAPPGSARQFDMADGMYIGGFLNGTPEQYVQFNTDGVKVFSPTKVRIEAPLIELSGEVHQMAGNVTMDQNLQVDGTIHADGTISSDTDVISDTISGKTHTHGGVTPGGSQTAPPT